MNIILQIIFFLNLNKSTPLYQYSTDILALLFLLRGYMNKHTLFDRIPNFLLRRIRYNSRDLSFRFCSIINIIFLLILVLYSVSSWMYIKSIQNNRFNIHKITFLIRNTNKFLPWTPIRSMNNSLIYPYLLICQCIDLTWMSDTFYHFLRLLY